MSRFRSEKQRRWMWKFRPDIAKRWAHSGNKPASKSKGLPTRAKKRKGK